VTDDHPWDGPETPYYLDLEPQSEAGKAISREKSGKKRAKKKPKEPAEPKPPAIPTLPKDAPIVLADEMKGGITDRARAATNMKVDGLSFQEIAEILEYKDAGEAKREIERTLAKTHSSSDWETLRLIAAARAEERLRRSSAMANADYLVLEDGSKVPNERKLQWHQLAGVDLMNWATITGAKAPTKMEITPDVEVLDQLVNRLAAAAGVEDIMDAEVIELDDIPAPRKALEAGSDDDDEW
jgi:hypothetical protein